MNAKLKKGLWLFAAGYLLFFAFRLLYGYSAAGKENSDDEYSYNPFAEFDLKRNYASSKMMKSETSAARWQTHAVPEQKYEKIARYQSKTDKFTEDSKKLHAIVDNFKAIVQFEDNEGTGHNRQLNMSVGVRPDTFDAFCEHVKLIGTIKSAHISKTDKTNEFKKLNAKKASLEKIRSSLIVLKSKGGKIDEYMSLENRILEIESDLQKLGVSLGEFDEENEFCTVYFTLNEGKAVRKISFLHRAKVAFEWSLRYYALALGVLVLASLATLLFLFIIEKLRGLNVWKQES